jgi:hypothetical protein
MAVGRNVAETFWCKAVTGERHIDSYGLLMAPGSAGLKVPKQMDYEIVTI